MGLFGFGKSTKVKSEPVSIESEPVSIKLNLTKEESIINLNLRKDKIDSICSNISQLNGKAKIALVLDYSGSMSGLYNNGTVQSIIERIIPIANKFDDNGELDLWIFENNFNRLESININNFHGYVKREITSKYRMGGTNYAPVIKDISKKYIEEESSDLPVYVIFITDGDNSDKNETTALISKISSKPIFWQFIGIGNASMNYLEKLDDIGGREIDNTDFFRINEINKTSDDYLYENLFNEYPSWLNIVKSKGLVK